MPAGSLVGRERLVQRAILTALSDVRLVDCDYEVRSATVATISVTNRCSTTLDAGSDNSAHLKLVLVKKEALDYAQISACINARIADLDCLSGRESKLRRCARVTIKATVSVYCLEGPEMERKVAADEMTSSSIIDRSLGRNAVDRMLGVRDLRLVSIEQRLNLLISLGLKEPSNCLDDAMCGHRRGEGNGGQSVCPIEEIGEGQLDEPCCATGCEPCVWETYYHAQARERRSEGVRKRPKTCGTATNGAESTANETPCAAAVAVSGGTPPDATEAVSGTKRDVISAKRDVISASTRALDASVPTLNPERLLPLALLERTAYTHEMLVLTFAACVCGEPPAPWHVKVRAMPADGGSVMRAYTVLRCEGGRLELLVKIHEHGKCSQSLARLAVGECVEVRGPVATDTALHHRLFSPMPPPVGTSGMASVADKADVADVADLADKTNVADKASVPDKTHVADVADAADLADVPISALHCHSAGSGLSPMFQLADALVQRATHEEHAAAPAAPRTRYPRCVRIWSVTRRAADALVPSHLAALQHSAQSAGVTLHLTAVLTREPPGAAPPPDPYAPFGGRARVLVGRPALGQLLQGVDEAEVRGAILVICGPDDFNTTMRDAALEAGYARDRVVVRD